MTGKPLPPPRMTLPGSRQSETHIGVAPDANRRPAREHVAAQHRDFTGQSLGSRDPEVRAMKGRWKRFVEFCADAKTIGAICATTLGAHAWLRGLITRDELHDTVQQAVAAAVSSSTGRIKDIETNTADLPKWRSETNDKLVALEKSDSRLEGKLDALPLLIVKARNP